MCQFLMFPMPIHLFATCCLFKSHGIQTSHQVTTPAAAAARPGPRARPSSVASSAARFCPPTGAGRPPEISTSNQAMGMEAPKQWRAFCEGPMLTEFSARFLEHVHYSLLHLSEKKRDFTWVDSKDIKELVELIIKNRGIWGGFISDGEFWEPKLCHPNSSKLNCSFQTEKTNGRTWALKRLCIYAICSSPILCVLKWIILSVVFFKIWSYSIRFHSIPFHRLIYLISTLYHIIWFMYSPLTNLSLSIYQSTKLLQPNLSDPSIGFNPSCWNHIYSKRSY